MPIEQIQLNFNPNTQLILQLTLAVIMFGVALNLRAEDFTRIIKNPKAPITGLVCQFFLLPATAYVMVTLLKTPAPIALGVILVAACPGGNLSNFLTNLAGGNAATSVTMSAISTLLSIIMTPLNLAFWGGLNADTAQLLQAVQLSPTDIMLTVLIILILPTAAGMICNRSKPALAAKLREPMKLASMAIFSLFVLGAVAANFEFLKQFIGAFILPMFILNAVALLMGFSLAKTMKLKKEDVKAVAFETGIQNTGFGLVLAIQFFRPAGVAGGMELMCAGWGIWHIVTGMALALSWKAADRSTTTHPAS